jgi:hypothetical protein
MRRDGGFVLPFLMKEQPRRVFAIGMDMMRETARFGTRSGAMLNTQRNDLLALGRWNSEGSGNDDHNFSVARVVLFDI